MKRLVAVLLCMTMAVSITACGNSETENNKVAGTEAGDKPESISVICSTDEEGLYEYAGKKYEEMYGVKVNLICQSYDSTHEKITTTWTGGGDADVCYVDIPWVAEFESKGVTIDLSEYMDEDVKNSLIESSLNQMIYNGKTEAIPFANGGKWMFYNKQMLADAGYEEPPKTWDELKEMSQDMMDKGICKYGIAWGASQAEGLICDLTTMIYSFGGTWQKEDGSFDINSESANNAVQFMYDSMQDGWADPASITYTDRDCLDPFMADVLETEGELELSLTGAVSGSVAVVLSALSCLVGLFFPAHPVSALITKRMARMIDKYFFMVEAPFCYPFRVQFKPDNDSPDNADKQIHRVKTRQGI